MNHERADDGLGKAPERKEAKNASLLDKILAMLPTFIVTGVLGTILAAWFQERGWAWQEAVHQVEKDTASAMDSLQLASDLLNRRWSAASKMAQATDDPATVDVAKARENLLSVNHDWELGYADADIKVQFNVDRPFGIDAKLPDALWNLPCTSFPFGAEGKETVEPSSAHIILNVIDSCHEAAEHAISKAEKTSDHTARKKLMNEAGLVLQHIYYINDALRCVILQRAIEMRRSLDTRLGWWSFFWIERKKYKLPDKEGDCFSRYRTWFEQQSRKQS